MNNAELNCQVYSKACQEQAAYIDWLSSLPENEILNHSFEYTVRQDMGFITYHGMTAEQFLWAWFKYSMLEPKFLSFESNNVYYEALKPRLLFSQEKWGWCCFMCL